MSKKKKIIIGVSLVVLAIAAGVAAFFIFGKKDEDKNDKKDNKPKTTETITIKFDADGGEEVEDMVIKKGESIELPTTSKEGYVLDGWYLNGVIVGESDKFEEDSTLKAGWTEVTEDTKTFKVSFDTKGGSKVNTITVICDKTLKLPQSPKKDGYSFVKWTNKAGKTISSGAKLACEDITLYANWKEKTKEPTTTTNNNDNNTTTNNNNTTTTPKEKTYKCPDGFELKDTNKCVSMKSPEYYCETGKESNGTGSKVCYSWAGNPTSTTCKNGGIYLPRDHASALCGYDEVPRLTGNVSGCSSEVNGTMVNNRCFKRTELATESILNHTCPGTSTYRTSAELGNTANSGCYNISQRTYGCKKAGEGYSINHTYGKCVKTVNATLE